MARQTYAYLGAGKTKMREVGAAAPFLPIGNSSALTFGAQLDKKQLKDFTQTGGGNYAEVNRVSSVDVSLTVHDIDGHNLSIATNGAVTHVAAGTVTAESVVAYKGGTTPLSRPPATITTVTPVGGGTAYAAGTDYLITPSGIEIPTTSTIPAPVAGAPNIEVNFTNLVQQVVEAMVNSGKEYEVLFEGYNEAEQDLPVVVHAYRVKFAPAQAINWIGDDFAALELVGSALKNGNIVAPGLSKYWKAIIAG